MFCNRFKSNERPKSDDLVPLKYVRPLLCINFEIFKFKQDFNSADSET